METDKGGEKFEDLFWKLQIFSWTGAIKLNLANLILLHVGTDISNIPYSQITYNVGQVTFHGSSR